MASGPVKSKGSLLAVGGGFLRGRPETRIGRQVVYLGRDPREHQLGRREAIPEGKPAKKGFVTKPITTEGKGAYSHHRTLGSSVGRAAQRNPSTLVNH